jgi:hypothetical protein
MSIKIIDEMFKRMIKIPVKTPLGRWNIHNGEQTTLKIKYATEDNCGVSCPTLQLQKDDKYIYMMGYESL